jgi:hypothetical protein
LKANRSPDRLCALAIRQRGFLGRTFTRIIREEDSDAAWNAVKDDVSHDTMVFADEHASYDDGGHRRPVLEPHADLLRSLVAAKSGITLAQIQAELRARGIVVAALSTILLTLRRLGLRHKKRHSGRPSRTGRMERVSASAGACGSATWTAPALSSWTRRAPQPR